MAGFIIRRLLYMIPMMFAISIVTFIIIQLPPGDFLTALQARLASQSESIDPGVLAGLRERYGLDQPFFVQYWKWISGIVLRGDFGQSFDWNKPVSELIWGRMNLTMIVSVTTLFFVWAVAFPIGIYSAVRQYSAGDYFATFIGFLGLAIPNFLLALVLMYLSSQYLGMSVGGLFSPEYINAAGWSWGKLVDLASHMWIPVIVLGTGATASLIRIMRANLLDELHKPYVEAGRAKGLPEARLILTYPTRVALNPFISTVGWVLPALISGELIVSTVLNLPTAGPLLLQALKSQDMYLAGAFILLSGALVLIGTLVSDILLAISDPRIRLS